MSLDSHDPRSPQGLEPMRPQPGQGGDPRGARHNMLDATTRARIRRERSRRQAASRAGVLFLGLLVCYLVLAIRTAPLMLGDDPKLQNKARIQFQQPVELEARRGAILDRDGTPLAVSVAMPVLHVNPSAIAPADIHPLATALSRVLGSDVNELVESLSRSESQDVLLAKAVHPSKALQAVKLARRGVFWTTDKNRRYYPGGAMGVALLGSVGADGRGTSGMEFTLDHYLKGDTYKYVQLRDRKGRGLLSTGAASRAAHQGSTVTLTIDKVIQIAAENALDGLMAASKPSTANIVVLDVKTGEVLAIANRPSTNPNDLENLDPKLLYNHVIQDAHEPGSVFKPFVVALALEAGVISANSLVDCEGGAWRLGSNTIKDDHPHGTVTLGEVIKYSSNIGAAKMGLRAGAERVMSGLSAFGFGHNTNLGLPGEVSGFVRSPGSVKPIELATTSFGQGVTASALQLASAVATIGNGGTRMHPFIVKEIRDRRGDLVHATRPRADRQVLSERTARTMAEMMVLVTEEGGTGTRARIPGYAVAGKTGTAQKVEAGIYSPTARVSSFIGFVPADDPAIAIVVMADSPTEGSKYGGIVSAPAFAQVAEVAMRHLRIAPREDLMAQGSKRPAMVPVETRQVWAQESPERDPTLPSKRARSPWSAGSYEIPLVAFRWASSDRLVVPDLSGLTLRDVLRVVQGTGVEIEVLGSGRAVAQNPLPQHDLRVGERLEVRFE